MDQINTRTVEEIESLAVGEKQFRELANNAPILLWHSGVDKNVRFFNQNWLTFTGRTLEEELGFGWTEAIHPDDLQRCRSAFETAFDARQPYTVDYRLRRHDGVFRWIRGSGAPYYREDGSFAGYFGSAVDITDSKEAEQRLNTTLNEREELLGELHHRTKNMLQIIVSLAGLQASSSRDEGARDQLRRFAERIQAMALVQEQVFHSRNFAEIDLASYLLDLARSLIGAYGRNVHLEQRLESYPVPFKQATSIGLIANELITNALSHAFPNEKAGTLTLVLRRNPDGAKIVIADDGPGLPADFDPQGSFGYRLITSLLAQVNATIATEMDRGTRITLTLQSGAEDA